jgi:hypothetical protein
MQSTTVYSVNHISYDESYEFQTVVGIVENTWEAVELASEWILSKHIENEIVMWNESSKKDDCENRHVELKEQQVPHVFIEKKEIDFTTHMIMLQILLLEQLSKAQNKKSKGKRK